MDDQGATKSGSGLIEWCRNFARKRQLSSIQPNTSLTLPMPTMTPVVQAINKPGAGGNQQAPVSEAVKKAVSEAVKRASSARASPPERVPGNYYIFDFLIEIIIDGKTHLGRPCRTILDTAKTPPVTRWFSDMKFLLPDHTITRVPWVDDQQKGLSGRTLTAPEDLLGAEGTIGDKKCFFEQILDPGKNVVVFSIYCNEQQFRLAYGFSRDLFKADRPSTLLIGE